GEYDHADFLGLRQVRRQVRRQVHRSAAHHLDSADQHYAVLRERAQVDGMAATFARHVRVAGESLQGRLQRIHGPLHDPGLDTPPERVFASISSLYTWTAANRQEELSPGLRKLFRDL